jgi:hypothetical protein
MRRADRDRLANAYPSGSRTEESFAVALGVHLPHAAKLEAAIVRDLDPATFGVGWWSAYPALGDKRRILIGDYLAVSTASIETNLVEAQLHLFELLDYWEQQNARMADAVVVDPQSGTVRVKFPKPTCPLDGLPDASSALHVAGFFRAINSALDCLGAAIVGVAALNLSIVTTDFDKARTNLTSKANKANDPRQAFNAKVDELIGKAGPEGWLTWTAKFRHMLLHRARRLQDGSLEQRKPVLLGPDGNPVLRADVVPHLPSEPARSDIDAFRDHTVERYLSEHASETVHGILKSAVFLIDGIAEQLCVLWEDRKNDPQLLAQPPEQWPKTSVPDPTRFAGYAPELSTVNQITGNDTLVRRLSCAAIADAQRHRWDTFS